MQMPRPSTSPQGSFQASPFLCPWYSPVGEGPGKLFPPPATPAKREEQTVSQCRAVGKGSRYHEAHSTSSDLPGMVSGMAGGMGVIAYKLLGQAEQKGGSGWSRGAMETGQAESWHHCPPRA